MPENEQPQVEVTGPATIVTEPATPARTIDELIADRERVRRESLVAPYTTSTDPYRMARNRDKLYRMAQTEADYGNPDLAQFYISKANEIDTRRQEINTAQENARRALASTRDVDDFTRPVTGFFKKLWRNTNPFDKRKLYWAAGAAVGTFESAAFTLLLGPVGGWVKAGVNALILNALSWNKRMYDGDNRATRMGSFVSGMAAASIGYAAYKLFTEPLASQNCDNAAEFRADVIDALPKYEGGIPELASDTGNSVVNLAKGTWYRMREVGATVWNGEYTPVEKPEYWGDGFDTLHTSLLRPETYAFGDPEAFADPCTTCADGAVVTSGAEINTTESTGSIYDGKDKIIVEAPASAPLVTDVVDDCEYLPNENVAVIEGEFSEYEVKHGDTLSKILLKHGLDGYDPRVVADHVLVNSDVFVDEWPEAPAYDSSEAAAWRIVEKQGYTNAQDAWKAGHWIKPGEVLRILAN